MRNLLYLFLLIMLSACGGSSLPLNPDFQVEQTDSLSIFLDASASSPSTEIISYDWNLGNGKTASGKQLNYSYSEPGTYLVELTITNKAMESQKLSKQISLIDTSTAQTLTQAEPQSSFIIDNTSKQNLSWQLLWSQSSDNPQQGDWFSANPKSGQLAAGKQQEVVLTLKSNLKSGAYKANLTLEYNGGMQRFAISALVGQSTFSLRTNPDYSQEPRYTLEAGKGGIVDIVIDRNEGFSDEVALSLVGAPQGVTASFSPQSTTGSSSVLELSVANTVAAGDYDLVLKGVSAQGQTATSSLLVRVINTQNNFGLSLNPAGLELNPGETSKLTLTVNRNKFTQPVQITDNGKPDGVSLSYSENPVDKSTEISLSVAATTQPGDYFINFWGQAGGQSSSVNLNLTVKSKDAGNGKIIGSVTTDNSLIGIKSLSSTNLSSLSQPLTKIPLTPNYAPGQVLVKYKSSALTQLSLQGLDQVDRFAVLRDNLEQRHGLSLQKLQSLGQVELLQTNLADAKTVAEQLSSDPAIEYAEPNYYLYTLGIPNDPRLSEQWHLSAAGLPVAWEIEKGSSRSVIVAVIDSGFDLSHPDLASQFVKGYDFCGATNCANGTGDSDPSNGDSFNSHGTHVAGIIAAAGNNNLGVAGVAYGNKVKILPVKIFSDYGEGATVSNFINGIRWSVGLSVDGVPANVNPARVINMSLGAYFDSKSIQTVIDEARNEGALLIAATGNDGIAKVMSPAAADNVLGVGSINPSFKRSCFSNYGSDSTLGPGKVDLVAPGGDGAGCANVGILSTLPGGQYGLLAGTSMAAPVVAGIAALVLAQNPNLTVAQVEQKLLSSSYFDGSYMKATEYGAGVLRADLALGLPGPGTQVSISASGSLDSALDSVTLDLYGGSSSFSLSGLVPDKYTVEAVAAGAKYQLKGANGVNLTAGETESRVLSIK
ncbi:MAG: S8 family serine peptidase [Trueperaceae bacterium]|nr:S8 family serine peptidase [Trueperaceae bacterium]